MALMTPQDEQIPLLEAKNVNFVRCSQCHAFRNPFMQHQSAGMFL